MNMAELANCYGQTETSPVFTQVHPTDDMEKRLHSSGRVIQGVQLAIKDVDKIGFSKSFKSIVGLLHRLLSMLFRLLITCK